MKKSMIFTALAAAAIAFSCNKPEEVATPGLVHFHLTAGAPQTKTSLMDMGDGEYQPLWQEGDKIGVLFSIPQVTESTNFTNDAVFEAEASIDGKTADFSGDALVDVEDSGEQTIYAYYPSIAGKKVYKNGIIGLDILAEQHPVFVRDNFSFDPASDLLVSKPHTCMVDNGFAMSNEDMVFTRVSSVVKFNFNASSDTKAYMQHVKSVTLSTASANISGRIAVDPVTGEVTVVNQKTDSKKVVLLPTDDCYSQVGADGGNCLFASVAPVTVKADEVVTITVVTDDYTITKTLETHPEFSFPVGQMFVFNLNITDAECVENGGNEGGEEGGDTNQPTTVTFGNLGYVSWGKTALFSGDAFEFVSQTKDNVTFDYIRNGGSIYANTTAIRFYKSNELAFSAPEGYMLTSIVFGGTSFKDDGTTDVVTCTSTTSALSWSGKASSVTFTRPDNAASYMTLNSVTVNLVEDDGETPETVNVTSVALDKTSATLEVGETVTLVATVNPDNATNKSVTWSSNDEDVATVENGVVTAVAEGTATITVTTVDGSKTATCKIDVNEKQIAFTTLAQIFEEGEGAYSVQRAVVMARAGSNVILGDGTANIMLYHNGNQLEVGQVISLFNQEVSERNGLLQFATSNYTVTDEVVTPEHGTPVELLTDDAIASWGGNPQYQYIHVVGVMQSDNRTIKCGDNGIYIVSTLGFSGKKVDVYAYANGSITSYKTITATLVSIKEILAQTYSITIDTAIANGTVQANVSNAVEGAEVELTATPADGYTLSAWNVKTASNTEVTVTNGKFTMPAENVIVSAEFSPVSTDGTTVSVDLSAEGFENGAEVSTVDIDENVTVTFAKGTGSNAPKYYTSGTAVRTYGGNTITVTASSGIVVTGVKFTFSSGEGANAITANVGSYQQPSWNGSSNSVVFTVSGSSGHRRIKSIEVTYE